MLHPVQGIQILRVLGLHAHRPADVLQSRHLVAQGIVGNGAEIVPPAIPLGTVVQGIQGLLIPAESDILEGRLLILILRLGTVALVILIGLLAVGPEGIGIILGLGLLRVLDLLVGRVDLLHPPGSLLVARVQIRVIFFGQPPIRLLDFLVCGVPVNAQHLIGILNHGLPPLFSFLGNS